MKLASARKSRNPEYAVANWGTPHDFLVPLRDGDCEEQWYIVFSFLAFRAKTRVDFGTPYHSRRPVVNDDERSR